MIDQSKNSLPDIVQRSSEELSQNYPKWYRKLEWLGLSVCFILLLFLSCKTIINLSSLWYLCLPAFFCAWILGDFICGFVHWLADTWGSPDLPILGAAVIRPFREHHVDQLAMTKHDFVETNAANSLITLPVLIVCVFIPVQVGKPLSSFLFFFVFSLTIFGLLTNQIHKWSHTKNSPKFVRFLQKWHLVLNPKHHQIHHTAPFNKHYCITSGWLNSFLYAINFFPFCEKMITKWTGALPRRDDIGESAAKEILK